MRMGRGGGSVYRKNNGKGWGGENRGGGRRKGGRGGSLRKRGRAGKDLEKISIGKKKI